ncbi:MAG: hypothetical protein DRQ88_04335 [Epsilonproteobacteria bacterium]|nr:MAG: hypothetical protein DRQ89_00390 [Campylobacterota bacterium]RLA67128.1 MAG: hypothetical protein DRQ88_04335 [Campylobacterota bacterium]
MNKYYLLVLLTVSLHSFAFWSPVPGKFMKIAGAKDGTLMAVDHSQQIWIRLNQHWKQLPGKFKDISVGSIKYIIGIDAQNRMWKFDYPNTQWNKVKKTAKTVSVGEDGVIFITNKNNDLLTLKNNNWSPEKIKLSKVVAVNKNQVWGITLNRKIVQKINGIWEDFPGKLIEMDAYSDKLAVGVNSKKTIWFWKGDKWYQVPGKIDQVAFSGNDNIWGLNSKGNLYHAKIPKGLLSPKINATIPREKNIYKGHFRITNLMAKTHLSSLEERAILLGFRGWSSKWNLRQSWQIIKRSDELFEIKNGNGKCLEALNINSKVILSPCSHNSGQLWRISKEQKDGTTLENYSNQLCLAALTTNRPVQLIECEKDKRFFWKLGPF